MGIGEHVPLAKRRQQERAAEETRRWLEAGNEIKEYPPTHSEVNKSVERKTGHLTTTQRKALEAIRLHQRHKTDGWVANGTAAHQSGMRSEDFPGTAKRLVNRGFLETKTEQSDAGRIIRLYRLR